MSSDWKTYLQSQGAEFNGANLVGFASQAASRHDNTVAVLSDRAFIGISGPDTLKFLQGQISVHMEQLNQLQHRLGVACTPKGRMYSSFRILNQGDGYLLTMSTDIADHSHTTLGKYSVFFKSELTPRPEMIGLGISGNEIIANLTALQLILPEEGQSIAIDGGYLLRIAGLCPRFELWINEQSLPFWWEKLQAFCQPATADHWRLLDIESVQTGINTASLEKYIPQHLNMPTLGAVSFRKGCYTGQEIVTRMQSLGQQKSRTYRLISDGIQSVENGAKLFDDTGKPIGEVLCSVVTRDAKGTELLGVIRIDSAEGGTVFLDATLQTSARVQPLPYLVDMKAELQQ